MFWEGVIIPPWEDLKRRLMITASFCVMYLVMSANGYLLTTISMIGAHNRDIIIDEDLDITEMCIVLFHEMAHRDWGYSLNTDLGAPGYQKNSRNLEEQLAEAVAWGLCSAFGIPADSCCFHFIAYHADDCTLLEFNANFDKVYRTFQLLTKKTHSKSL